MLQTIRNHAQGWIAWVIVGLIILTFALFGIDQYARGDKVEVVASVNGEDITAREFLTLYNRQQQRLKQQFGDMFDQVVKDEELREQVLQALIESEAMRQWGQENGLLISDQQLAATIHAAEVFQQDGKFSQQVYEDILQRNGLNVARFEYEQRQFLLENQYRMLTLASAFSTGLEVDQLAQLQGQEREVNYLRVDHRPFLKTVTVSDAEVADYYAKQQSTFVEPEKVVAEYIELSQAELAKQVAVTDEALQAYYNENQALFTLPEKRHAKHILIAVTAGDDASEAAAQATLAEVQQKLQQGESFEALAKTYSQDPGSASSGGDLGSFEQGMMVPEFDKAVFAMQVGQVSEPVKTDFGYHLIKLEAVEPKQTQPFAEVKGIVTQQYQMQQAEKQYFELLEQVNTLAYEQADSLQPAAEAAGLKVNTSEAFGRDGGQGTVFTDSKVINSVFSDEVLKSRLNSASIDLGNNHAVVVRVKEHFEARQKALEEVAGIIKERLVREAALAESAKLAQSLLTKVEAGENPESLMSSGIEWHTVGWVDRNNQRMLPQMTQQAFKAAKPVDGKPSWRSFQLVTGDTVLIQIKAVKAGEVTPEQKTQLAGAMSEMMAATEAEARLQAILAHAEVVKKEIYKTIK